MAHKGTVKRFNGDKGYGFVTPDSPKEIPGLQTGKDVFVHVTGLLDGTVLRDGQRVEFGVRQGNKGPEAYAVRPEGQTVPAPVVIEIRQIAKGEKGPAIVTGSQEAICLPGKGLRDLSVGTPIAITAWEVKPRVRIASGFPLNDRLVVRRKTVLGYGDSGTILQAGMAFAVSMPSIMDFVETSTEVDRMFYSAGARHGDILTYHLIKEGSENEIRRRFAWAVFLKVLVDGFGLYDIVKGVPTQIPDDRLATDWQFQDSKFLAAFRPHNDRQPIAGNMVGMDDAMAELIRRHLAPIVIFQRRVARGEITGEAAAQAETFWTVWEQHREVFCAQHGPNVTVADVLAFLLATESVFPEPNDGLTGELATIAREWSRTREAADLMRKANAARSPYSTLFPEALTESDLAQAYVAIGREPQLEELVDFDLIEVNYPSVVDVPGVGQRAAKYQASNGKVYAAVRLTSIEIMQATADPMIPGSVVWGYTCEIEFSRVAEPLQKMKGWAGKALLRQAFLRAKPILQASTPDWWTEGDGASLPEWPAEQVIAHVDHAGDVTVFPYVFRATASGIVVSGWAQSEGEIQFARQSFAQARGVWEARRGAAVALCSKCGQPLWATEVPGSYQGMTKVTLVCPTEGCKSLEYPYLSLFARGSSTLYLGHSHTGEGTSFEFERSGIVTGARYGAGQRPATLDELDRIEIALGQLERLEQCQASIAAARNHLADLFGQMMSGELNLGAERRDTVIGLLAQVPELAEALPINGDRGEVVSPIEFAALLVDSRRCEAPNEYGQYSRNGHPLAVELAQVLTALVSSYRAQQDHARRAYMAGYAGDPRWQSIQDTMRANQPSDRDNW